MNVSIQDTHRKQLLADFNAVVADAEALLVATANQGGEELATVRARAEDSLRVMKAKIDDEQVALLVKTSEVASAADAYVHDKPWSAVGIAAGIGLMIGLLSGRH
tara:strand:- start:711 stop:1025 length:315 start_codon:yes stop_codon:yes gene_type:complete